MDKDTLIKIISKRIESSVGTPAWLVNANPFNEDLRLTQLGLKIITPIFYELISNRKSKRKLTKIPQKLLDFDILCANLMYKRRSIPVSISLDRNNYTKNKRRRVSHFLSDLIHLMINNEMIGHKKGYRIDRESYLTRIWPEETFLSYFKGHKKNEILASKPIKLVQLKDVKKKLKDYPETSKTKRISQILERTNQVNRSATIQIKRTGICHSLPSDLHAVFNNSSFRLGGRLYTEYKGYQGLSKDDRKHIVINNEKTIELDYSGLLPRILYAQEGKQFPLDKDPYKMVYEDAALRPILKIVLLACLNSNSEKQAKSAGNNKIHEDHILYRLLKKEKIKIVDIIKRFKIEHQTIAHHFFKGSAGLKVMNKDS